MLNSIFNFLIVHAATYTDVNTNIPCIGQTCPTTTGNPVQIIADLYKYSLALGGVIALFAIIYGAIQYAASAGNVGSKSEGRDWITSALLGLLLLAGAYIILHTINPDLTQLKLPSLTPPPAVSTTFSGLATSIGKCSSGQCVPINLNWEIKNGNLVDPVMLAELQCISDKGVSLRITEAMPTSSPHQSKRHNNGCAVDATLPGLPYVTSAAEAAVKYSAAQRSVYCSKICDFKKVATSCGSPDILNEYDFLCSGVSSCPGERTEFTSGDHVHINANCGL